MEAHNRKLSEWFNRVETGQVLLPRFQRHEAWGYREVAGLLETVVRGLPAGATLILQVGDKELFHSRPLEGAPKPTERVSEHLLDGQQRITALWRALHDDYPDRTYFVCLADDDDHSGTTPVWSVRSLARWTRAKDGETTRYPVWADDPKQVHDKGWFPATLLRPGDRSQEVRAWVDAAVGDDHARGRDLEGQVHILRGEVTSYNIPYLALPVGTAKDVALDVFIQMNTSAIRLTAFDIVVAQFEAANDSSLHELVEGVEHKVADASRYRDIGQWVLDVAALREGRTPTQASYQQVDLEQLADEWDGVVSGIEWAVGFLRSEHIFDAARLPSVTVLPILAALWPSIPTDPDGLGNATTLLRSYLWRAFLTARYEQSAGTRSLQDFTGLAALLRGDEGDPPILDAELTPLPAVDEVLAAGWPKRRDIVARGIMAVSLRAGARDLADDAPATATSVRQREYHHLFPNAALTGPGGLSAGRSFRAVNCALITWRTNRKISAKAPLDYMRERAEASTLGEAAVRARLRSHLIPFDELARAGHWDMTKPEQAQQAIATDYAAFTRARAELLMGPISDLCSGRAPVEKWLTSMP